MKGSRFFLQNSLFTAALVPNSSPSLLIPSLPQLNNPFLIKSSPVAKNLKKGKRGNGYHTLKAVESIGSFADEDDELCPVDCVREFKTDEEFLKILEKAKGKRSLVVVDFYKTSCGSCKYIEQGFGKLCRGAGDGDEAVIFLKHNVIDEYDEQSEVADRLRIKAVPLFQFYKDGALLESFATRDKERILGAIQKYTSTA